MPGQVSPNTVMNLTPAISLCTRRGQLAEQRFQWSLLDGRPRRPLGVPSANTAGHLGAPYF